MRDVVPSAVDVEVAVVVRYHWSMVSLTVNVNEAFLAKLKSDAEAEGKDVGELLVALAERAHAAHIAGDDDDGGYVLSPEEEQRLIDADAAIDRGEFFTLEQMRAQMKAARER
jgi:hypothetical protein